MATKKFRVNRSWLRPRDKDGRPFPKYYRRGDEVELDDSLASTKHLVAGGAVVANEDDVEEPGPLYTVQPPTPVGYVVQAPVITPGDAQTLASVDNAESPQTTPAYPPHAAQTPSGADPKLSKKLRKDSSTDESSDASARAEHEAKVQEVAGDVMKAAGAPTAKSTAQVLKEQQEKNNKSNDSDNAGPADGDDK